MNLNHDDMPLVTGRNAETAAVVVACWVILVLVFLLGAGHGAV